MGMIESTIALKDKMAPVLDQVINSMNLVISSAYEVETASGKMFNSSSLELAKGQLSEASVGMKKLKEEMEIAANNTNKVKNEQENYNRKIKEGTNHASNLANTIKSAIAAYVSVRTIKAFAGLSDEMSNIKARLDAINDGHQSTVELQNMIFASAQRSRGEYQMTMDIVSKLGAQAKDAFDSNKETIQFAENLNKLFRVSGTSAQGVESVMYNLTQAMASGVLRGQDLNAVMSNTPQILQIVSDYMGITTGEIRKMAEEGKLSAQVVKNALLGATEDINAQFEKMPKTFGQIAVGIKNNFIYNLQPALEKMNEFANSDAFEQFSQKSIDGLAKVANIALDTVEILVGGANLISDNWSEIGPIVWGVVGAFAAWTIATNIQKIAQMELNVAMLANPMFIIPAVIGILIAAYMHWANSVGGVAIANKIAMDFIMTKYENLKLSTLSMINNAITNWERFGVGVEKVKVGVLNTLTDLKVSGLMIIEAFINGAIDSINDLIRLANKVPGVSIEVIDNVTFATQAGIDAERIKAEREAGIKEIEDRNAQNETARDKALNDLRLRNIEARRGRARDIYEEKEKQLERQKALKNQQDQYKINPEDLNILSYDELPAIAKNTKETKKNTDKLKDGIKVENEDIRHLKELAERRAIQNFTFDKLEVIANNTFGDIHETVDLDGWVDNLADELRSTVESTMGGVPSYEY